MTAVEDPEKPADRPVLSFDERYFVLRFAKKHGVSIDAARRVIKELGPAQAEALAAAGRLRPGEQNEE